MTTNRVSILAATALGAAMLVGLPLLGVLAAGRPLGVYLEFPPLTQYVEHAPFSWAVFVPMAVGIVAVVVPFLVRWFRGMRESTALSEPPARQFPWWGWCGAAIGAGFWVLAWTRFAWFAPLQRFTFSPLWFAYIVVVNALVWRRTGRSMLTHEPVRMAALFALSAVFWWYFEYLNRFVQNWHYTGVEGLSAVQYAIFATLPFSTVLPAVMGTCDLLESDPRTAAGLEGAWRLRVPHPRSFGILVLLAAAAGLAGVGLRPDWLFPLLWIAPLAVIVALQLTLERPTVLDDPRRGDWARLARLALAALICGFFWEMWNWGSLARWEYSVPFVNRFHLFEMPVLGYAGYLPFGVECAVIADMIPRRVAS